MNPVNAPTLKRWLEKGEAVLVDVREPAEYRAAHIKEAKLIPLSSLTTESLPRFTGRKLVIHCHKGGRSTAACQQLIKANLDADLYNLEGGIEAWVSAGLPVQESGTPFLPLDRQVQLVVGLGILIGSILSYTIHPAFIILTGFFGAGLTFAGITGFCGLARLLACMPWNK